MKTLLDRLMPTTPLEQGAAVMFPLGFLVMKLIGEACREQQMPVPTRQVTRDTIAEDLPLIVEEARSQGVDVENSIQVAAAIFPSWEERVAKAIEKLPGHAKRFVEEARLKLRPDERELRLLIEMSKSRVTRDLIARVGPGDLVTRIFLLRKEKLPPGTAKRLEWAVSRFLKNDQFALA